MTTIKDRSRIAAGAKARDELARRSLSDALLHIRARIESDPRRYGGMVTRLERAERATLDGHIEQARDHLIELKRMVDEKDEAARLAAQQAEQEALAEARHQPTVKAESGASTRDGWLWLLNKKRYSGGRVEAGRIFREKYARAHGAPVKSCLSEGGGGSADASPLAAYSHARFEIEGVRQHMVSSAGFASGMALYELLTAVVGRGETVRQLASGDDRKAEAKVIELGFALDLAGVYLGAVRA